MKIPGWPMRTAVCFNKVPHSTIQFKIWSEAGRTNIPVAFPYINFIVLFCLFFWSFICILLFIRSDQNFFHRSFYAWWSHYSYVKLISFISLYWSLNTHKYYMQNGKEINGQNKKRRLFVIQEQIIIVYLFAY